MSNRHFLKKKPQNKSYSPISGGYNNFLSPDDSGNMDSNAMGSMYEQIKNEVVSSVLNWLSMYMAADQEDKKINEQNIEPVHCCECTLKRRNENSNRSSLNTSFSNIYNQNSFEIKQPSSNNESVKYVDVGTYTEDDDGFVKSLKRSDTPEDLNMIITNFRAGQVWPDWCAYLEKTMDKHSNDNVANSQVYYDKFNDRLCVYRRGLVEYPQIRKISPRIENANLIFKQNLKSIPEVRESLFKNRDVLKEDFIPSPEEHLNDSNEYLKINSPKKVYRNQTWNNSENYSGLNSNQTMDHVALPNNLVKWTSLPNVQFQH